MNIRKLAEHMAAESPDLSSRYSSHLNYGSSDVVTEPVPPELDGRIEKFDKTRLVGWATDSGPPLRMTVFIDGDPEIEFLANGTRPDVEAAGRGPRESGFNIALPRYLQNGYAHTLEVRVKGSEQQLNGNILKIEGIEPKDRAAERSSSHEGVAFFDPDQQAISGWATRVTWVTVRFDADREVIVPLDREVPGLGGGVLSGFSYPVPHYLRDGKKHKAIVRFGDTEIDLNCSPVSFACLPQVVSVELTGQTGRNAQFRVFSHNEIQQDAALVARMGGAKLHQRPLPDGIELDLPEDGGELVFETVAGERVAGFICQAGVLIRQSQPALPEDRLMSPEALELAQTAFDAFCEQPDFRFDPDWYRQADPQAADTDDIRQLIRLYRQSGARRGVSPNPQFDEHAMRNAAPVLADLVAQGKLPCLFALELALGENVLSGFSHLPPRLQAVLADDPASVPDNLTERMTLTRSPRRTPAAALDRSSSGCIYTAWVSRLIAEQDQSQEIADDDNALMAEIASTALLREPLVSVIMPSWNRAYTIGEAIQSVLDQSYPNWELIICDDASTDHTAEVVRSFDDPRIRYNRFLKSNGAGARNKGLRHARGEFIAYLDSDNIWHPGFLDLMIRRLLGNPGSQIAFSGFIDTETVGASVKLTSISRRSFRPIFLSGRNFVDLNSLVHHRRLYDWLDGFDSQLPRLQDWDLVLRYTSVFRPIFVNRLGVFYRRNIAWGQVTHLEMRSNARSVVLSKTRDRLSGDHVQLRSGKEPVPPLTVLPVPNGDGNFRPRDLLLATALSEAASEVTPTDLVLPKDAPVHPEQSDQLAVHRADAEALLNPAAELGDMASTRPVLCVGAAPGSGEGYFGGLTYFIEASVEGGQFRNLDDRRILFSTGPVPLRLPNIVNVGRRVLLLAEDGSDFLPFAEAVSEGGIEVLVPPLGDEGWQFFSGNGPRKVQPDMRGIAPEISGISLIVSVSEPERLSALSRAILAACQSQGVPLLTVGDISLRTDGFAEEWINAGAAQLLSDTEPEHVAEAVLSSLQTGAKAKSKMREQARHCHAVADHQALFAERLLHLCLRAASDRLVTELVSDDDANV
ncbi:glycosyltransferase family 2 protein [Paracoccus aerodenitrificans]|uniref:glycosyltransferase family 2 protein n=1 Tax=Paracoccus aerodenitrificans TaxID=3017781 RepID=UPI0022F1132D|nr:glycosyltransferase family 2 protein [Paracoccus aerodenitrificans]WBU63772.1 glycosyltransferase family 2 protein [Paracoccus aerodenitrificans]